MWALELLRAYVALAQGSSGTVTCHLSSSTHLLAQDSIGVATCPEDGLYML
jgi:hypothetical protein